MLPVQYVSTINIGVFDGQKTVIIIIIIIIEVIHMPEWQTPK
jgi:hypothetical protein